MVPSIGVPIPAAVMFWPTRKSYTGQPCVELHMIGAPPLLEAVLERLCEAGARMARRGEFTMRAFLSGRIDLLQAEAVAGVIEAADHEQLEQALSQMGGRVTQRLREVQADLIALLGDLEAGLDFVEEDIEFISHAEILRRLIAVDAVLNDLAHDSATRLPSGFRRRVVLAGLPNAGKSTLFNVLAGSQRAIVSHIPGTTRDYLTVPVRFGPVETELVDTAGWEDAADLVMSHAQELRRQQISASDVVLWCTASDLTPEEFRTDQQLCENVMRQCSAVLRIQTRSDLEIRNRPETEFRPQLRISAASGEQIEALRDLVSETLGSAAPSRSELVGTTAVRCRDSLIRTRESLQRAKDAAAGNHGDELISLEIRQALRELSIILGEVYTDDILDHIFSHFCIGK